MRKILAAALALVSLLSLVHLGRATLPGLRGPDVLVGWEGAIDRLRNASAVSRG